MGFIAGTQSAEMRQGGVAATRALVGERLVWIEGTHLYPMQHPKQTAELVLNGDRRRRLSCGRGGRATPIIALYHHGIRAARGCRTQ